MAERWNAYKISLKDITRGKYDEDGYLSLNEKKVRRVNVIGDVVNKFISEDEDYGFLVLDDGTETLRVKSFEETLPSIENVGEGDLCKVIGRIRKYEEEVYIVPEIVRKIENINKMVLRKLELFEEGDQKDIEVEESETKIEEGKSKEPKEDSKEKEEVKDLKSFKREEAGDEDEDEDEEGKDLEKEIKKIIRDLDENEKGVKIKTIIERSSFEKDEVEEKISDLMKNGEIFEPRPGKVRML